MTKNQRDFVNALEDLEDPHKAMIRQIKAEVRKLVKEYTKEMSRARTPQEKQEIEKKYTSLKKSCAARVMVCVIESNAA